jgi:hypothetical protein
VPGFGKHTCVCLSFADAGQYDVTISNTGPAEDTAVTLYVNGAIADPQSTKCRAATPPFTQLPLVQPATVPAGTAVVCSIHGVTPSAERPLRITAVNEHGELLDELDLQHTEASQPSASRQASSATAPGTGSDAASHACATTPASVQALGLLTVMLLCLLRTLWVAN